MDMKSIGQWAERIYNEDDFGKSVAILVAGLVGLCVYLLSAEGVIAAFAGIITFPFVRVVSTAIHDRATRRAKARLSRDDAELLYDQLSPDEKAVVGAFVHAGGCVLTWRQMNQADVTANAVESLAARGLMGTSVMVDGFGETFVLDTELFDVGQARWPPF